MPPIEYEPEFSGDDRDDDQDNDEMLPPMSDADKGNWGNCSHNG